MGAEAIKEGDTVAVYRSGIRGNHLEKKVVRRLTTTLLFVEGSDDRFSRRTGQRQGGTNWTGAWVEPWAAHHEDALKRQEQARVVQAMRRKLSDFRWGSLSDDEVGKVADALKAAGVWSRFDGE
jgi:hypothetical protein